MHDKVIKTFKKFDYCKEFCSMNHLFSSETRYRNFLECWRWYPWGLEIFCMISSFSISFAQVYYDTVWCVPCFNTAWILTAAISVEMYQISIMMWLQSFNQLWFNDSFRHCIMNCDMKLMMWVFMHNRENRKMRLLVNQIINEWLERCSDFSKSWTMQQTMISIIPNITTPRTSIFNCLVPLHFLMFSLESTCNFSKK